MAKSVFIFNTYVEFLSAIYRIWRELLIPDKQRLKVRFFVGYCFGRNFIKTVYSNRVISVVLVIVSILLFVPVLQSFMELLLLIITIWSIRPSTAPKNVALLYDHQSRICILTLLVGIFFLWWKNISMLLLWFVTIFSYFFFELRTDRTFFKAPHAVLVMSMMLMPIGIFLAVLEHTVFGNWLFYVRAPFVGLITVPLCVERFHIDRNWYEPL